MLESGFDEKDQSRKGQGRGQRRTKARENRLERSSTLLAGEDGEGLAIVRQVPKKAREGNGERVRGIETKSRAARACPATRR